MFKDIQQKVRERFNLLREYKLFSVDVNDEESNRLFNLYLDMLPEELRQEHNCNCCKQFLRNYGGIVAIINGKIETLWDFEIEGIYSKVPKALQDLVIASNISKPFLSHESSLGVYENYGQAEDKVITWNHFNVILPGDKKTSEHLSIATIVGKDREIQQVFQRGMEEFTLGAVNIALDLINQKSLYRGDQYKEQVEETLNLLTAYKNLQSWKSKHLFCWNYGLSGIRNTAIGTLLINLSEGMTVDTAVGKFEAIVAPENYKRPKPVVTENMLKKAEETIEKLGLSDSLHRRQATLDDIPLQDVLFVNRNLGNKRAGIFQELKENLPVPEKYLSKLEEVSIGTFISEILPTATSLQVLLEAKDEAKLMTVVAPKIDGSPSMFPWESGLSWSYNGGLADSTKHLVKEKGGNVDGVLRFSLRWNDSGVDNVDLDAHCVEPSGNLISFPVAGIVQTSSGCLDVDIINPKSNVAVENITWADAAKMEKGGYRFRVHNYSFYECQHGFSAEIEYKGRVYEFNWDGVVKPKSFVEVGTGFLDPAEGFKMLDFTPSKAVCKPLWNVTSNTFQKVSMVMKSPNHWGDKTFGHEHLFFVLDGLKNPDKIRGIFNEFLKPELSKHRKVLELLGAKMEVEPTDSQVSGVGFNYGERAELVCKVEGSFTRTIKIKF